MVELAIKRQSLLNEMINHLDLPKSVEEKTRNRYYSLADWFNRKDCTIQDVDIFVQGSFGQGTTIKPLTEDEEYDLDMSCKVNINNYKKLYTQADLMRLVKNELEQYRKSVGIQSTIEEKNRCLRLIYKDEVPFHLDFVPSVPLKDNDEYKTRIFEKYQENEELAANLSKYAVNIPDKENENYNILVDDWHISNQQGYLLWFQNKIAQSEQRKVLASVERIPVYKEKSILQRCIQLLKRHRDIMYSDKKVKDCKPISIIITTLAARSYKGERNIEHAIVNVLNNMEKYINASIPRVPNPVKPEEDFTDRWDKPKYAEYELEKNFYMWLNQAKVDFNQLITGQTSKEMSSLLNKGFGMDYSEAALEKSFGYTKKISYKKPIIHPTTKPWLNI